MRIGNLEIAFKPKDKLPTPPTDAVGVMSSLLYASGDFIHYNPDELLERQSYDIYRKMMRDEQIKAVYRFRRNSITGRRAYFGFDEDTEGELSEEEQQRRVEVFEEATRSVKGNFRRALNKVMSSMTNGFSLTEKTYKDIEVKGKTYWGLNEILVRPPETIFPYFEDSGRLVKVEQLQGSRQAELDMSRFIHHVHNPDEDDFYGLSELREAYRMWWSKDIVIKLRNIFLERMAGGLVWVQPSENSDISITPGSPTYTALQGVLNSLTTKTGMILPKGIDMHVETPKDSRAFDEAIKSFDKGISKAALMPNLLGLSEQDGVGSYGQSQTHLEAFLWMLDGEADNLVETLNEQLFKEIGDYNFGDGLYPCYKLRPLSKQIVEKIAGVWGDLVSNGAVEATDTDEDFLRDYLEIPEKGTPIKKSQPQPTQIPGQPAPGIDPGAQPEQPSDPGAAAPANPANPESAVAETIAGKKWTEISTEMQKKIFDVASRRVDFMAIDASAHTAQAVYSDTLGKSMNDVVQFFVYQIQNNDALVKDPEQVMKLKVPSSMVKELRSQGTKMLKDGWALGTTHAKRELGKVKKNMSEEFHQKFTTVGDIATTYMKAKSFKMAGKLSQDALDIIQNILFNSIKFSKSIDDTVTEIYRTFAMKGMLDIELLDEVKHLLADAIGYNNPTARLQTTVRTNYFEAVNEARFSFFSDSELGGFVRALSYSSVLDSRSTDVCRELGGETSPNNKPYVAPVDAAEWDRLRPPNHFNCRGILVSVTINDQETVNQWQLRNQPQEGFK